MKFLLLREDQPGSGVFTLTPEILDTPVAEAAGLCAARQAAENTRFALFPYEALAVPVPPQPLVAAGEAEATADKGARRS